MVWFPGWKGVRMTFAALRVASGQGLRVAGLVGVGFLIQDQKATTVSAGDSIAGVNTRDLNTEIVNTIPGAVLGTNQFTLDAGTYEITATTSSGNAGRNRIYLYNVTDSAEALVGTSDRDNSPSTAFFGHGTAHLEGEFTIAATKTFEIRHEIEQAHTGSGLGINISDGEIEVYTQVHIVKV